MRQRLAVLAHHFHLAGLDGLSDRTLVLQPFRTLNGGGALPFGAAVKFPDHLRAEPFDEAFLQPGRARRRKVPERLEAGEIVPCTHLFRQRPDTAHHGRHHVDDVHLVRLDQAQRLLGIEARGDNHGAALEQRRHGPKEGPVVIERARDQHAALLRDLEQRHIRIGRSRRLRHDQLGPAGRAAGGHRLVADGGHFRQRRIGEAAVRLVAHRQAGNGRVLTRIDTHDEARRANFHNLVALELRQARGDRLRRGAGFPGREAGFEEFDAIGQGDGDEVVLLDAEGLIGARQAVGAGLEFAPGEARPFVDERRAGGLHRRPVRHDAGQ